MRRRLLPPIVVALATAAVVASASNGGDVVTYTGAGGEFTGLRPTGIGLPQIGVHGTVGASELVLPLRAYHDSGAYERDVARVAAAAQAYLDERLAERSAPAQRTCSVRYVRVQRPAGKRRLYRRVRRCHAAAAPPASGAKPAIVLDIDETSLSNYTSLAAVAFSSVGLVLPAFTGTDTPIRPTLELYRDARRRGVAVFFVTGRPAAVAGPTQANLRAAGYDQGWAEVRFKPSGIDTQIYKSSARVRIEQQGYDIIANIGDQESDLDGGHADRAFKLPNPFYFISD